MLEDFARGSTLIPAGRQLSLLELQRNINFPHVGTSFFTWEKPVRHQILGLIKLPSLAQQLDQPEYKDSRSRWHLWKTLQRLDTIAHRHSGLFHCPVEAQIHVDIVLVVLHTFAEQINGTLRRTSGKKNGVSHIPVKGWDGW